MLKTILKYIVTIVVVLFVAYNSVYFKKLDEMNVGAPKQFDAVKYAHNYVNNKLLPTLDKSPDVGQLFAALSVDPGKAFKNYAHAIGIGNVKFFMVKGQGTITSIDENDVFVKPATPGSPAIKIATEYVFGNALRDASGIISINEFTSTTDLNNVSAEINKMVRNDILPPFKGSAKVGDKVQFAGALELNQEHLNLNDPEIIPIAVKVIK
jgi:predicted lipoprotein